MLINKRNHNLKKSVAIIGSGIAGLSTAYFSQEYFDVTLFEKNDYLGGHANTREVKDSNGNTIPIDTGFIVYNELTYPNLTKFFDLLKVETLNSNMSFSFLNEENKFEYGGGSLSALFADRKNFFNLKFYKMLKDIIIFYKVYQKKNITSDISIRDFLKTKNYSDEFINFHLVPLISSIWSTPDQDSLNQPLKSIINFFQNHKLFNFTDRPQWKTIRNGSKQYINLLIKSAKFKIKKSCRIQKISRNDKIEIFFEGKKSVFDIIIFACPPNHFFPLLDKIHQKEHEVLNEFDFQKNLAQLHQNNTLMPTHLKAWSSWNFHTNLNNKCTLSYWMNKLQPLETNDNFFVSLNQDQNQNHYQTIYEHPIFSPKTLNAQKNISQIQGYENSYYVGSYLGYGFHEDGIQSAIKVCKRLNIDLKEFKNADTSRVQWN